MRHTSSITTRIVLGLGLSLTLAAPLWACLTSDACAAETTAETRPDMKKVSAHLSGHVTYPATRAQVLAACASTPEFTAGEKAWFAGRLPEGTYKSAHEVLAAVGK
jgi:hypothetical protein